MLLRAFKSTPAKKIYRDISNRKNRRHFCQNYFARRDGNVMRKDAFCARERVYRFFVFEKHYILPLKKLFDFSFMFLQNVCYHKTPFIKEICNREFCKIFKRFFDGNVHSR